MRLKELRAQWQKDPRATELRLTVPVLILERHGVKADETWERTSALMVGGLPDESNPELFFIEKSKGTNNPFTMGVTIGRVDSNDIVVDDSGASRFHAWLQFDERTKGWMLCDAESKNGTLLDEKPLDKGARVPLRDGSVIGIGQAGLRFVTVNSLIELLKK